VTAQRRSATVSLPGMFVRFEGHSQDSPYASALLPVHAYGVPALRGWTDPPPHRSRVPSRPSVAVRLRDVAPVAPRQLPNRALRAIIDRVAIAAALNERDLLNYRRA